MYDNIGNFRAELNGATVEQVVLDNGTSVNAIVGAEGGSEIFIYSADEQGSVGDFLIMDGGFASFSFLGMPPHIHLEYFSGDDSIGKILKFEPRSAMNIRFFVDANDDSAIATFDKVVSDPRFFAGDEGTEANMKSMQTYTLLAADFFISEDDGQEYTARGFYLGSDKAFSLISSVLADDVATGYERSRMRIFIPEGSALATAVFGSIKVSTDAILPSLPFGFAEKVGNAEFDTTAINKLFRTITNKEFLYNKEGAI